ncbi:MAG: helix-turn-helix domain-containing protein [Parvibaculum sp.]|nr:helix-turn-helix domain-containing protein [Parvibaculum sp.]
MSIATRLAQIRRFIGLSQKEMGKRVGVSGTTWQNYELENAAPNAHVLARLSAEGFDINWALTGEGQMRASQASPTQRDRDNPNPGTGKMAGFAEVAPLELDRERLISSGRHVLVPRHTLRAATRDDGRTIAVEDVGLLDTFAFHRDFIEHVLKADPATLIAIEAPDDTMQPTFAAGDILLADSSAPHMRGSGIYVFAGESALIVKRIQVKLDGGILVSSDNADLYPPEEIERSALDKVKIIGRVIWRGGRL